MAKTTAPLLSFGASGQVGKSIVASKWKGRPYMRRHVIPANPQSSEQTLTRNTFGWLQNVWRYMPSGGIASWTQYANNNRITPTNGWIKQNLTNLREETDVENLILSPASAGGIPAAAMTPTGGALQISVALTAPTLPTGWTIIAAHALAIKNQDPQTESFPTFGYATDVSDPYTCVITGLTAATEYVVGGWFSYQKTPTEIAYGISLVSTATTS